MNNLVSVIIPVFNRFHLSDRSIESVLNQSHQDWELIVIDDCSTENYKLPDVCREFENKIKLLRNNRNLGPGLTRQRGLELSSGDFVCFLDSDDFWYNDFLVESIKVHLTEKTDIAATYCQSLMTDGILRRRNEITAAIDDIFYGVISGVRPWSTCSIMWNKKFISKWSTLRTNQDAMFELNCSIMNSHIVFIPKKLVVIDKDTGENSENLVRRSQIESNRNFVLRRAVKLVDQYQGNKTKEIKIELWRNLLNSLRKQIKYKNYKNAAITIWVLSIKLSWVLQNEKSINNTTV